MIVWPDCTFCGDPVYGLAADEGIHPCCDEAYVNERSTCTACDMARGDQREPRPLRPDSIPVEDWDWDEIRRLDRNAINRLKRNPKCGVCTKPMVCGQTGHHCTCPVST